MKANVLTDWQHLEMKEVPDPKLGKGQVLIEVKLAGVCGSDVTVYNHKHLTATVPRIMCHEILGVVREINADEPVSYKVGDRVTVHPLGNCGKCDACRAGNFHVCRNLRIMGLHMEGGFCEYVAADCERVFKVDEAIPDRVAILTEPLAVGFHACARAGLEPGDKVFIIGGGPIGILTGVCASYFGASCVVVSEINPERVKLAESFGFETINPANTDVMEAVQKYTGGVGFDKVFEASGSAAGALTVANVCKISGTVVPIGIPAEPRSYETVKIVLKEISIVGSRVHRLRDFARTVEMIDKLHKAAAFPLESMIAGEYPLERLEEAILMQQSGKNNGKLIIKVKD